MSGSRVVQVPMTQIEADPIGDMLATSDSIKPYINHYIALLSGSDGDETLRLIAELPEEKRYISRVLQCLDWALADCDPETLRLDVPYISDLNKIKERLQEHVLRIRLLLGEVQERDGLTFGRLAEILSTVEREEHLDARIVRAKADLAALKRKRSKLNASRVG